ncbi:DUF4398 domain-containing protein, partial [Candidatus Poribacteria bacterium]|nr:DUF4398 domain-containing protein [Candidatus Poribacteria bacterium]
MKQFIASSQKYNFALRRILMIGLLLVPFAFAGCGGKLGKIEAPVVDTAIADAEAAITAAKEADAPSLAPDAFEAAKSNLEAAKTALEEKRGNDALQHAYQAIADAKLARKNAINITTNSELNAAILEKEAKAEALRNKLSDKESALKRAESEMQTIRGGEAELKQKVRDLQKQNRELNITRENYSNQVAELLKTVEEMQARGQRVETEIQSYGKEISA